MKRPMPGWRVALTVYTYLVIGSAIVLTAMKGTLDWLVVLVFATLAGLPHTGKIFALFRKDNCNVPPDRMDIHKK